MQVGQTDGQAFLAWLRYRRLTVRLPSLREGLEPAPIRAVPVSGWPRRPDPGSDYGVGRLDSPWSRPGVWLSSGRRLKAAWAGLAGPVPAPCPVLWAWFGGTGHRAGPCFVVLSARTQRVPPRLTETRLPGQSPCASATLAWAACAEALLSGNRRPRTAPLQRTGSGPGEGAVPARLRAWLRRLTGTAPLTSEKNTAAAWQRPRCGQGGAARGCALSIR